MLGPGQRGVGSEKEAGFEISSWRVCGIKRDSFRARIAEDRRERRISESEFCNGQARYERRNSMRSSLLGKESNKIRLREMQSRTNREKTGAPTQKERGRNKWRKTGRSFSAE
ncbi:hypothetical protein KM043_012198 [Ampulex compressa]|nr:hypothetical protein KM043_012198 [Ampulex compressa]